MIRPLLRCSGLLLVLLTNSAITLAADTRDVFVVIDKVDANKTIGELKPAYVDFSFREAPRVSIDEVIDRYIQLIGRAADPRIQALALLRMENLEDGYGFLRPDGFFTDELWDKAIEVYGKVLTMTAGERQERQLDEDLLRYQLAKAFDIRGRQQESLAALQTLLKQSPKSQYGLEARFRVAEAQYTQGDYEAAERNYRLVTQSSSERLIPKAEYMLAWTLYKNTRNQAAIDQFLSVLVDIQSGRYPNDSDNQAVEDDVARIISVIATQNGGESFLNDSMARMGSTDLAPVLYKGLFLHQLGRQRYQDAASVAEGFIQRFPLAEERPAFHQYRIEAFETGRFPELVWKERERFVTELGQSSDYWNVQSPTRRDKLRPQLYGYGSQIGRRAYALGQAETGGAATVEFEKAAYQFSAMLELAPVNPENAQISFLLGDTWLQLDRLTAATLAYDQAAYAYGPFTQASDAAYAGVTTRGKLLAGPDDELDVPRQQLTSERTEAVIRFADNWPDDSRAPAVLLIAAVDLYQDSIYERALTIAGRVTAATKVPVLTLDALEIQGGAAFALSRFAEAETGYQAALDVLASNAGKTTFSAQEINKRKPEIQASLLSSMYKQAETWEEKGDLAGALQDYQRVAAAGGSSELAESARFSAAMRALDLKDWPLAIELLRRYQKRHPDTQEALGVPARLAFVYVKIDQPGKAGDALSERLEKPQDAGARRETLLQIADFYRQADRKADLVAILEQYVSEYPRPFEPALESVYELYSLALEEGSPASLRRRSAEFAESLMTFERNGDDLRTIRSRTLAAEASWAATEVERDRFEAIRLLLPLAESLGRKTASLRKLVADIDRTQAYGIAEYVTAANHTLGQAYLTLSKDVLASERPAGLNALESEQYTILLEDQAYPFEEQAISTLEANLAMIQKGIYDSYIEQSIAALSQLLPVRYDKQEVSLDVARSVR